MPAQAEFGTVQTGPPACPGSVLAGRGLEADLADRDGVFTVELQVLQSRSV
jgi:hypothetical protein